MVDKGQGGYNKARHEARIELRGWLNFYLLHSHSLNVSPTLRSWGTRLNYVNEGSIMEFIDKKRYLISLDHSLLHKIW